MWVRELDWAGRLVWSNGRGDGRQVGELYPFRGACQVSVADPPTAPVPALPDARIVCSWRPRQERLRRRYASAGAPLDPANPGAASASIGEHALAIATLPLPSGYPVINQPLDPHSCLEGPNFRPACTAAETSVSPFVPRDDPKCAGTQTRSAREACSLISLDRPRGSLSSSTGSLPSPHDWPGMRQAGFPSASVRNELSVLSGSDAP